MYFWSKHYTSNRRTRRIEENSPTITCFDCSESSECEMLPASQYKEKPHERFPGRSIPACQYTEKSVILRGRSVPVSQCMQSPRESFTGKSIQASRCAGNWREKHRGESSAVCSLTPHLSIGPLFRNLAFLHILLLHLTRSRNE